MKKSTFIPGILAAISDDDLKEVITFILKQ